MWATKYKKLEIYNKIYTIFVILTDFMQSLIYWKLKITDFGFLV